MKLLPQPIRFEWDAGNQNKNWAKHNKVGNEECEEVFFDPHKRIASDALHSGSEPRYLLLGTTRFGRPLFIVFTVRGNKVRVISARDLNKKEEKLL